MMFITSAECARCGRPLKIYPGIEDGPGADGDLYLQVARDGTLTVQALCKNIQVCDDGPAA